ncbi:MAG TPA: TonB-dependent receptor [Steroidobacteraceae bacterium]|jgi:outer membrane receptor protein involved in Fe transport
MQRSKKRKQRHSHSVVVRAPLAGAVLLALSQAHAQEPSVLGEVVVTAQKRGEQSLQDVPFSIQALSAGKLEELNIVRFDDYVKFLPSVSYQTFGPGYALVYMRGVSSGGDGNHSGSQPSVGIYLDEQPITTIQGALDLHLYDIARVESLAGPQGTLYGASSQAGTIRIITNRPDPSGFSASYGIEGNAVSDGDSGYLAEGYVNVPIGERAAIRLVGWARHDAGYIDNISGTRTWPTSGITLNSAALADENFNEVDTYGARAALRVDLNDSWTISPTLMAQEMNADGVFGYDPNIGDLEVLKFYPDKSKDSWMQAALTVEGKIGNMSVTYAGAYLDRDGDVDSDYSDYSYFYDVSGSTSYYFVDDDGDPTAGQYIQGQDRYERFSHELRVSTPADRRLRFVGGVFYQKQEHDIQQRYLIDNLAASLEVTGWDDTVWLTKQFRVDEDKAVFGELTYDLTDKFSLTGGMRYFESQNSMTGFFGYGLAIGQTDWSNSGEVACFTPIVPFRGAPCTTLDNTVDESDWIGKINLSYKFDDDRMIYLTWSEGFRPGGTNRNAVLPPYLADFLTNYEAGWKTSWADGRVRFNGAVFLQEWEDFQYSLLGSNGLTEIKNAAQAEITGLETDLTWAVTDTFQVSGGFAYINSELSENYCGFVDANGDPETDCPTPEAPKGTELPVTPEFKANLTLRQEFPFGAFDGWWRASMIHQGKRRADLRDVENALLGDQPSYELVDFSLGATKGSYSLELFVNNVTDERTVLYRFTQCAESVCLQPYHVTSPPRTIGLKFTQRFGGN